MTTTVAAPTLQIITGPSHENLLEAKEKCQEGERPVEYFSYREGFIGSVQQIPVTLSSLTFDETTKTWCIEGHQEVDSNQKVSIPNFNPQTFRGRIEISSF